MSLPHARDTEEGAGRAGLTEEVPRERNLESGKSLQARNLWEQLGSLAFGVGGCVADCSREAGAYCAEGRRLKDRFTHTQQTSALP